MRYLYLACLGLLAHTAHGQAADSLAVDVVAADSVGYPVAPDERWVRSQTDSTGECAEVMHWSGPGGLVCIYYASGRLKEYAPYANLDANQIHGLVTTWHENGQIESRQHFLQGKRQGKIELYYEDGQLKRLSNYAADVELLGKCFDTAGRVVPFFPYEQPAFYPGGQMQLVKEIDNAIRFPHEVVKLLGKDDCTVHISFLIEKDGSIRYPRVDVASSIPAVDSAVLAIIQKLKLKRQFIPARRDGLVVQSKYIIPIRFRGM